jgi:hypothetical protein
MGRVSVSGHGRKSYAWDFRPLWRRTEKVLENLLREVDRTVRHVVEWIDRPHFSTFSHNRPGRSPASKSTAAKGFRAFPQIHKPHHNNKP